MPLRGGGDLRLEAGLGVGRTWLGVPDGLSQTTADAAASFGTYLDPRLSLALRGHVQLGQGTSGLNSLGLELRDDLGITRCQRHARRFVAAGPAFAHIHGPGGIDALAAVAELRVGIIYRSAHVSLDVMPGYAFANDSIAANAQLHWLARAGFSIGVDY